MAVLSSPAANQTRALCELTAAPDYFARISEVVLKIQAAADTAALVDLLYQAAQAIGADVAFFVCFLRDGDCESFRFLLACDPRWCVDYERLAWYADDPWLAYAKRHAEPIRASELNVSGESESAVVPLAERCGFRSTVIVPAPASGGLSRLGMLCLGSHMPGFYENEGFGSFKVMAQPLANAFHDGCIRSVREEIRRRWQINPQELTLLSCEFKGLRTKQIAKLLGISTASIDSHFQRVNVKLGVLNRKAAARLAAEYGLI
jgi:DNA-binding CsgD family transcriptional regulator